MKMVCFCEKVHFRFLFTPLWWKTKKVYCIFAITLKNFKFSPL